MKELFTFQENGVIVFMVMACSQAEANAAFKEWKANK